MGSKEERMIRDEVLRSTRFYYLATNCVYILLESLSTRSTRILQSAESRPFPRHETVSGKESARQPTARRGKLKRPRKQVPGQSVP